MTTKQKVVEGIEARNAYYRQQREEREARKQAIMRWVYVGTGFVLIIIGIITTH